MHRDGLQWPAAFSCPYRPAIRGIVVHCKLTCYTLYSRCWQCIQKLHAMHIKLQKLHASHCCFALFNNQPKMDDPKSECHANQFRRYANPLGCQPLEIWTIPNQNATPINSGDTQTHLVATHLKSGQSQIRTPRQSIQAIRKPTWLPNTWNLRRMQQLVWPMPWLRAIVPLWHSPVGPIVGVMPCGIYRPWYRWRYHQTIRSQRHPAKYEILFGWCCKQRLSNFFKTCRQYHLKPSH